MDGIKRLADGLAEEFQRRLPKQRKTQRTNLSLLVATMLDVRSANLMDLAAGLPREAGRIDMRYQWISRVLMNPLIDPDVVMAPFAREVLSRQAAEGHPLVLILDQSKLVETQRAPSGADAGGSSREARLAAALAGGGDRGRDRLCGPKGVAGGRSSFAAGNGQSLSHGRPVLWHGRPHRLVPGQELGLPAAP